MTRLIKSMLTALLFAALSACLLLAITATAMGSEAYAATADSKVRVEKFSAVLDESRKLEAGVDYVPGVLVVHLDGSAKLSDSATTLKECIVSADAALSSSSASNGLSVAGGKSDTLFELGKVELVAAGDWLKGKVVVTVEVPDGVGVEEALALLKPTLGCSQCR